MYGANYSVLEVGRLGSKLIFPNVSMYSAATIFPLLVPGVKQYTIHLTHEDGPGRTAAGTRS